MLTRAWIGLTALITTYLGQPLCHSLSPLLKDAFGQAAPIGFLCLGIAGLTVVALAVNSEEGPATVAGFTGGLLAWQGFVDGQLSFMARLFDVPKLHAAGGFEMSGKFAILMSSVIFLVPLFFIYGLANRESKCSMMRFVFRHSHASPGNPTPGLGRSFARLTALETLFVKWSVYVFALWVYGPWATVLWSVIVVWLLYLVWKLARLPRSAYALRYAIPISAFFWSLTELGSARGYYTAIWLLPRQHAFTLGLALAVFVAGLLPLARRPNSLAARPS